MRKLILLLTFCILGITQGFTQKELILNSYTFDRMGRNADKKRNEWIHTIDYSRCLDTMTRVISYNTTNFVDKTISNRRTKYNEKGLPTEIMKIDSSLVKDSTGNMVLKSLKEQRTRYIYTSLRSDTIINEDYDYTSKKWTIKSISYKRKAGIGNDTLLTPLTFKVYDSNSYLILDVNRNTNGTLKDSTVYVYKGKDLISKLVYSDKRVKSELDTFIYNEGKISERIKYRYFNDITRVPDYHIRYYYENNLLMAHYGNAWKYTTINNPDSWSYKISDSSRYKVEYTYDANLVENGYTDFDWNNTTKSWEKVYSYKTDFNKDSMRYTYSTQYYTGASVMVNDYVQIQNVVICNPNLTSTQDRQNTIAVTLSPNPSNGYVNIALDELLVNNQTNVRIYNIQGVEVYQKPLNSGSTDIDLSHLTKGFYLLKVGDNVHSTVKKLILN